MSRIREKSYRVANGALIRLISMLHRRFDSKTTYKIGPDGVAALFENCWFSYSSGHFGCTGNIDYHHDAENETRSKLFTLFKDENTFFDIGAHGGVYTLTLLEKFPNSIVHSFEPQPEELLVNLYLNARRQDRVHSVALGDEKGSVRMTTNERSSNHVSRKGDRTVPIVRLDDFSQDQSLPSPDWIKIDIEGMELPALRGAERLLRESRPVVICEINRISGRYGSKPSDLIGYLGSLGYAVHALQAGELQTFMGNDLPDSADWNYWFLPNEKTSSLI